MSNNHSFRDQIRNDLENFISEGVGSLPKDEVLRMDTHCHDLNSDVPDELWGRILRLPETWLPTEGLLKCLRLHHTDVVTITNHNNAKSCWALLEKGADLLSGAEFTCTFPEYDLSVHVLTYGFGPEHEAELNRLRKNIYKFLEYTAINRFPTVLAHPLYFYARNGMPSMELFEKFALLFERYEVINGQRDTWQNLLTISWIKTLTEEKIDGYAKKHGINPNDYCTEPFRKRMTGGSDDHMGTFAGGTGVLLHVPDLAVKRKIQPLSQIALDVIRDGNLVPYGAYGEGEKLGMAFLDYFCQVAINMKDPGLVRLMLHKGTTKEKLACLAIGNAMMELQRHKHTIRFLKAFHNALKGKGPNKLWLWQAPKQYQPMLEQLDKIAVSKRKDPQNLPEILQESIPILFHQLSKKLTQKGLEKARPYLKKLDQKSDSAEEVVVNKLEIPSNFRRLMGGDASNGFGVDMADVNLSQVMDRLSFPVLASAVISGSTFASNKVLYRTREFLNQFAGSLGQYQHPQRILWLTDTLYDKNGVSSVLRHTLEEIRKNNLPIDFLICTNDKIEEPNIKTVSSLGEIDLPQYGDQIIRIPDLMEVQKIFRQGGYDRIICSTELIMGVVGLYLKKSFTVPAYFYMHTDWIDFIEKSTDLNSSAVDRVRRVLRAFYHGYDGVFVLNQDHRKWLTGPAMGLSHGQVLNTAHWTSPNFKPVSVSREEVLGDISDSVPVLLYAGRLSREKGVMELPGIMHRIREFYPEAELVVAGEGPAREQLEKEIPEAKFTGWVDEVQLTKLYSASDLLLLPSRFDTFGCVVLEAMSCGLPVAAYDVKGPKDIVQEGLNGFLCRDAGEMAQKAVQYLSLSNDAQKDFRQMAIQRGGEYQAKPILAQLLKDCGIGSPGKPQDSENLSEYKELNKYQDLEFDSELMNLLRNSL